MQTGCRRKGVKSFLSEFKFRSRAGGGGGALGQWHRCPPQDCRDTQIIMHQVAAVCLASGPQLVEGP